MTWHGGITSGIRRYTGEYTRHVHEHAQIMFALQGRMTLEVDGHSAFADSSCGLVIPAGAAHGFLASPDLRMFVIDLPDAADVARLRRFVVTPDCRNSADLTDVALQLACVRQAPCAGPRRGIDLAALAATLSERLNEPWSTPRMAQECFLSPQRFHQRLRELTGLTPQAFLRAHRLDRATTLLRQGVPLETTALQVGYASASALAFALRRERGQSSRQLRMR